MGFGLVEFGLLGIILVSQSAMYLQMKSAMSTGEDTGFKFLATSLISSAVIYIALVLITFLL